LSCLSDEFSEAALGPLEPLSVTLPRVRPLGMLSSCSVPVSMAARLLPIPASGSTGPVPMRGLGPPRPPVAILQRGRCLATLRTSLASRDRAFTIGSCLWFPGSFGEGTINQFGGDLRYATGDLRHGTSDGPLGTRDHRDHFGSLGHNLVKLDALFEGLWGGLGARSGKDWHNSQEGDEHRGEEHNGRLLVGFD